MSHLRIAIVALAVAAAGCGNDDADPPRPPAAQEPTLEQAAQRLDQYLREHTSKMTSSHAKAGQLINLVEPFEGKLKVYLLANADGPDPGLGNRVCRVVKKSGIAEAKGALVVDVGDAPFGSC